MKNHSETAQQELLKEKIMGLGEKSMRKSYYPELQKRIRELEEKNQQLQLLIAEKEKITLELAESKATMTEIIDYLPTGIYRLRVSKDANLNVGIDNLLAIDFVSAKFREIFSIDEPEKGSSAFSVLDRLHADDRMSFMETNDISIKNFEPFSWQGRTVSETGDRWVQIESFPRLLPNGDRVWTGMILDITDRIKNEKLEQDISVARKSLDFKQNFLANMSHEIRTPLTGIEGMAHILVKTDLTEQQRDYLETILLSSQNLRQIINQILDYSRIEAGQIVLKPRVIRTNNLIEKISRLFVSLCNHKIPYKINVTGQLPAWIETDEHKILQIVSNFVSNAVKYAGDGLITFNMSMKKVPREKQLEFLIKVTDSGKGISEDMHEKIFAPFSQLEQKDQRNVEGTGLGLSISKQLAHLLGGNIGVESKPGKGSTFWFTFRATPANTTSEEELIPETTHRQNLALNILLVEDKIVNQKVISLMLRSLGHSVEVAENGVKALEKLQPEKHNLVLMDIQMPEMDGITATRKLKETYKELPPIVGLSANAFEGDKEKYMERGMDDYLTKPVRSEDFTELINKWF